MVETHQLSPMLMHPGPTKSLSMCSFSLKIQFPGRYNKWWHRWVGSINDTSFSHLSSESHEGKVIRTFLHSLNYTHVPNQSRRMPVCRKTLHYLLLLPMMCDKTQHGAEEWHFPVGSWLPRGKKEEENCDENTQFILLKLMNPVKLYLFPREVRSRERPGVSHSPWKMHQEWGGSGRPHPCGRGCITQEHKSSI